MKKIYCAACRKFKNPKISYIFEEMLLFSVICRNCGDKDKKIFKKEEQTEILKIHSKKFH